MSQAPGPRGNWLVGNLSEARRDPLGFFVSSAEEHGDVVRFRFGPATAFLLRGADAFKQVFIDEQRNFTKDTNAYRSIRLALGNGLVTSEGDFWLRQRRIAQPAFRREKIASVDTIVAEETSRMLDGWVALAARGEPFDVFDEVTNALARITGRSLLGTDVSSVSAELSAALGTMLELAQKRALSVFPLPPSLPTPQNRRMRAAREVMDRFIYATIDERRAKGARGNDLLSRLMTAKDEETGEAMTAEQLRDEVMTLYSAGFETTATGLAWSLYLLSKNPAARDRLHLEVDRLLGDRTPRAEDLAALGYARRVVDESMRLRPPVWNVARRVRDATTIGGFAIPPRAFVFCCAYVAHRNPRLWPRPEDFDPDRFLPERMESIPRLAYLPFGAGPRMCIGSNMALLEITLMLAMIAQRFALTLVPDHPVVEHPLLVLRPRYGIRVTAQARGVTP